MEKIRWGVLGTAGIARDCSIPGMQKAENCERYGIAGRSLKKAEDYKDMFGFEKAYEGYEALLSNPKVQAVYIPLPNNLHYEWVKKAIAAGKHVLCEKPLAPTPKQTVELFEAAKEKGVFLMEPYAYLHSPFVTALKKEIEEGTIGEIRYIESQFLTSYYDKSNKDERMCANMKKFAKILAAAVLFGTAAGTAFQGAEMIGKNVLVSQNETVKDSASAKLATTTVTTNQSTSTSDVSSISEQVLPSIVAIDVTAQTTTNTPFGAQTSEGTGSASGIIIAQKDNKMYIATNNHVVKGATSVTIIFNDGSKVSATVKGTDSSTDLAVVEVDMSKLSDSTKKNIKIATIGDSKKTKVGEQAIAIGNALGYGTSVTVGYISAKDREIDAEDSASVKLIQTDAAINPGNSGGALVNSKGEVIAINSSKFASEEVEGMGFAIPMATAEPILEELMNQKEVAANNQAYLGITGRDVTSEYEQAYGIPQGIYISEVSAGSPAEKAGLQKGYIITKLNGTTVKTLSQLQEKLSKCEAGTQGKVTVKIASGSSYQEKTFSVTFGKKQN